MSQPAASSRDRYRQILLGSGTAFAARGLTVTVSLAAVPLTLPYLGAERFGAWAAITAAQVWLQLADAGLSAGITTPIAAARVKADHEQIRRLLTTAMTAVAVVCVGLLAFVTLAALTTDLGQLASLPPGETSAEFVAAFLLGFVLALAGAPYALVARCWAVQGRPEVANLWQAAGQLVAMVGLLIGAQQEAGLVQLVALTSGSVALFNVACVVSFWKQNPAYAPRRGDFTLATLRQLRKSSLAYTILQLAGMLLMNSSVLLAAVVLSAAAASEYAVSARLAVLCSFVAQLVAPYFWAVYADVIVRGDRAWLRRAFRRHLGASVLVSTVLIGIIWFVHPYVIREWTDSAIEPNGVLMAWLLCWQLIVATMSPIGAVLNAHDRYTIQTASSLLSGCLAIGVGAWLAPRYGVAGVAAATVIPYLLLVVPAVTIETRQLLLR